MKTGKAPLRSVLSLRLAAMCATAALVCGGSAIAQSGPSSLDRSIVTATAPLSSAQQAALEAFASTWIEELADPKSPRSMDDARRNLTDPLRDLQASMVFRRAASQAILPKLEPIIDGADPQQAIHALQVVRFIRTPEAIEALTARLAQSREPDVGKRLAAASALGYALSDSDLSPVQFDAASRAIGTAGERETSSLVILQGLRALSIIANRPSLAAASVESARSNQIRVFKAFVGSIGSRPEADTRIAELNRAILAFRDEWVRMSGGEQAKLGAVLAPALGDALTVGSKHWVSAHRDPTLEQSYRDTISNAETLLRLLDKSARTTTAGSDDPQTLSKEALVQAWSTDAQKDYDAVVARWKAVLQKNPYR